MAKTTLKKLGLKKNQETKIIYINDNQELPVEVVQYLPIEEKLQLLERVVNSATQNSNFYNPGQINTLFNLEIVYTYTNIQFTEKQKEDFLSTYDLLESNGVIRAIYENIPEEEISKLINWVEGTVRAIYEYRMSAYGILDSLKDSYNELNFDLDAIKNKLQDPDNLALLKDIIPLMGLDQIGTSEELISQNN